MLEAFKQLLQGGHIYGMRFCSFKAGGWHAACLEEALFLRVKGGVPGHVWVVC